MKLEYVYFLNRKGMKADNLTSLPIFSWNEKSILYSISV